MKRACLILTLLLSGCFGCEQETKPDPNAQQVIGAWMLQVGGEAEIVYVTAPVRPAEVTVRVNYAGKR